MELAGERFVRKVVARADAQRLRDQSEFMRAYRDQYSFPEVLGFRELARAATLDIQYLDDFTSLDRVLGSDPTSAPLVGQAWERFISERPVRDRGDHAWKQAAESLWTKKVVGNVEILESLIPDYTSPTSLVVNGQALPNLREIIYRLHPIYMQFPPALATPLLHGDLTLSNSMVSRNDTSACVHAIDPNPRQPLVAREVALAKLLQSLEGAYELLEACRALPSAGRHLCLEAD